MKSMFQDVGKFKSKKIPDVHSIDPTFALVNAQKIHFPSLDYLKHYTGSRNGNQ